jgi:hypothetical protein
MARQHREDGADGIIGIETGRAHADLVSFPVSTSGTDGVEISSGRKHRVVPPPAAAALRPGSDQDGSSNGRGFAVPFAKHLAFRTGAERMTEKRDEPIVLSAEKARQGDIILRKRWQRFVFVAGMVVFVLLAVALRIFAF